jgi:hypothetical protein
MKCMSAIKQVKQPGWKTALNLACMTQGPYGNTSAGSEHLFMSYKMLQISHSSDYFFIQQGMNVSAVCPPVLTDRPYLALFKLMNVLRVKCPIIMTFMFSNILKLKHCHRSLFKQYCRSLLNQGQMRKLNRGIIHHLLIFNINYQAHLCHYIQSHATVFVFYSLVAGKASC